MKQVYTYFGRHCLRVNCLGDPVSVAQKQRNLLKSPKKCAYMGVSEWLSKRLLFGSLLQRLAQHILTLQRCPLAKPKQEMSACSASTLETQGRIESKLLRVCGRGSGKEQLQCCHRLCNSRTFYRPRKSHQLSQHNFAGNTQGLE